MGEGVEERIFVRPRRHFRRTYSTREVGIGALLLAGLGLVAAWVGWRGAHPDPELSSAVPLEHRAPGAVDRGPLPAGLAPEGWRERRVAVFDPTNVYEKIDGREGYYKSFGFQRLHTLTLVAAAGDPTVDLELYDLGSVQNALGAAAGEIPASASPALRDGTLSLVDRNTLYLARGKYYLRAIGSAESPAVRAALESLGQRFVSALPAAALPFSYELFVPLGVTPGKVSYLAENAFSFGFASAVHLGQLPDGDTELFAVVAGSPAEARALATRFNHAFAEYGKPVSAGGGIAWAEDRYLSRISGAGAAGRLVLGVHSAADVQTARGLHEKLVGRAASLPDSALVTVAAPPRQEE
jgi:Family of unknown function (DUF6599)